MEAELQPQEEQSPAHVVGLSLCDSAPLLWRLQDLKAVRSDGLVGALLGSLPRTPRQNVRLGRPLLLLPEEERLLGERRGVGALPAQNQVSKRAGSDVLGNTWVRTKMREQNSGVELELRDAAGGELQQRYVEQQRRSFEEQSVLALEERKSAFVRAMTSSSGSDEALQRRLLDLEQNFNFPRSALAVQLSTARAGLSHCPEARAFLEADWPIRAQRCPRREARFQVFRDLRGRGFFLTSAGKFGGDFLVYPGDPLRFHAHFIAVCLALDESVCLLDVLCVARLGSNVKKTVLLCSPAPDGPVRYTSLQWSGMNGSVPFQSMAAPSHFVLMVISSDGNRFSGSASAGGASQWWE
ncbi:hypothetical protein CCH79_00019753 [Gambusia affinis]|uniref:tRNA-splicing endonuclease subunit Sen34 n=1 Tax=Gambusia affinis TaxID=33528 RepID=A0A315VUS4_GAMAF|nr:hypothetical protein CCH79_00019753 [Gambusia affinis]